jgi:hypothetical protein
LGLHYPQAGFAGARPSGKVKKSNGKAVLIAVLDDEAFVAGAADGQVGGAFGALGFFHNPFAQGTESR